MKCSFPARLAESCWLVASAVVPLSVNLQGSEIYHAPKALLSQCLGLVSLLAILGHFISGGARHWRRHSAQAIGTHAFIAAAALLLISVLSTFFSIDQSRSQFTSPLPSYSPFSLLTFLALMASMILFLRSREQVERFIVVSICASIPVALIAALQRYGLIFPGTDGTQASSLAGGAIFLAGYLMMIMPLTVRQLYLSWALSPGSMGLGTVVYASALLLQFSALLACEKRGAFLSLAVALCLALVLWGALTGRTKMLKLALGVAVVTGTTLVTLSTLREAGLNLRQPYFLDRLSRIVPLGDNSADPFRAGLWNSASALWFSDQPLVTPSGATDPLHAVRFWLGYGPDTVAAVIPTKWIWIFAWPQQAVEDSCHSMIWDLALSFGLLGVAAFFWLFFELLLAATRLMRIKTPHKAMLAALSLAGAAGGAATLGLLYGPGFAALGAQVGFLASFVAQICRATLQSRQRAALNERSLLGMALMVALAAHWIDVAFLFQSVNTATTFWLLAGLLCAASSLGERENSETAAAPQPPWSILAASVIGISLLHAGADLPRILTGAAPLQQLWGAPVFAGSLFLAGALSIASVVPLVNAIQEKGQRFPALQSRVVILILLLYAAGALWFAKMFAAAPPDSWSWFAEIWAIQYPALLLLGVGAFCLRQAPDLAKSRPIWPSLTTCLIALLLLGVCWQGPLRTYRGDVLSGFAMRLGDFGYSFIGQALALSPANPKTRALYVGFLTEWGLPLPDKSRDPQALAARLLEEGIQISDYNLQTSVLGRLYLRMAARTQGPTRVAFARKAQEALQRAVRYIPQNEKAWFNASIAETTVTGRPEAGVLFEEWADALTARHPEPIPSVDPERWAEYYANEALATKGTFLFRAYADRALHFNERAIGEKKEALGKPSTDALALQRLNEAIFWCLLRKSLVLSADGRHDEAEQALQEASEVPLAKLPIQKEELWRLLKKNEASKLLP